MLGVGTRDVDAVGDGDTELELVGDGDKLVDTVGVEEEDGAMVGVVLGIGQSHLNPGLITVRHDLLGFRNPREWSRHMVVVFLHFEKPTFVESNWR